MVDKLREVYESDPLAMASAYGVEAVDPEETVQAAKDVAQFGWESLPGVGTYYTVQDITEELEQENPNYMRIGMLAGTEVIGLIPGIGDAAANMIRKGADLAKPAQEVVEVTSDIPKVTRKDADVLQAENLLDDPDALKAWQEENKLPETQRQANPEESQLAADALFEGEATSQETRRRIREAIPAPQEYTAEQVMEMMPTVTEVTGSLGKKAGKYGILGVKGFDLKEGQKVSSRLDIPAYNNYNTWVVSIHDGTKDAGLVEGFGQAVRLKNIEFKSNVGLPAIDIARGKRFVKATGEDAPKPQGKATIARIFGEYTSEDPYDLQRQAADIIASGSEEWTQVGMNPYRGSAFYDKKTGMPVFEADEVIQVGPLVLAKNVKKPTISQMKEMAVRTRDGKLRMFNEGGMAMDEQMNAVFKSSRTGYAVGGSVDLDSVPDNTVGMDPVSGNEIPLGSLPEEVRDDIPAQLSEGEYVVPADVVRYYGVKFFEDLRAEAKFGYQDMNENGRIGGEPAGMEMVEPEDDMMFDISELEVMEVPDEPVGAFFGGFFSKKEKKSPEQTVRDRFEAVSQREKQKRTVVKNADGTTKTVYSTMKNPPPSNDDNNSGSNYSGPSIAEQINFGGDYEDVSSSPSSSGSKSKSKSKESLASKSVRRAYTGREEPEQGVNLLENKPDAFGNLAKALGFADGGYALNPGDPGYDEMGSLGLGSEGLPLGTGQNINEDAVIEMVAYVNEEGRVIYIMHINGVPQNEVPPGFYIRTEEESTPEGDATDAQPAPQVVTQSDDNDDGPDMPMPTPIDYQNLTLDEMQELMDDMNSPTTKAVTLGVAAMAGPVGLLLKGAMMHQERQIMKEMERRLSGELTTQDRARLEGMIQEAEGKKGGIFAPLKGKMADLIIGEEQGPGMDIQPPKTYTPEVAAGSVTLPTTPKPEGMLETSTDDLVKAFAPPEQFAMEEYQRAQQRKAEREAAEAAAAAAAAEPAPKATYSESSAADVIQKMKDRGASASAVKAAEKESAKVKSAVEDINRGVQRGFKKGGLASKKKKK